MKAYCGALLLLLFSVCEAYPDVQLRLTLDHQDDQETELELTLDSHHHHGTANKEDTVSEPIKEINNLTNLTNLTKTLDHLQSKYNNLTKDQDHLQSKYDNLTKDLEQMTQQKDVLQSRYNNVTELKKKLCELSGWQPFGRGCYYISTERKTWEESRQYCRAKQSDLIIINSKEEQDFVNRVVNSGQWLWLGLTDREKERVWKWVDGSPLTTPTYWKPGQPDINGGGGDCAVHWGGYGWYDIPCTETLRWMCEKAL